MSARHFLIDCVEGGILEVGARARVVSLEGVGFEAVRDSLTGDEYFDDGTVTEWALQHAPFLEEALDMVEAVRAVTGLDVEALARGVECARGAVLESRALEAVRDAAVVELERALVILEAIGSGEFDSTQALEWVHALEVEPSDLHGALVEAADVLDVEARVRMEMLEEYSTLEAWALDSGYSRGGTSFSWFDEYGDEVDIEAMHAAAVESRVDHALGRGVFAPRRAAVESSPVNVEAVRS